MNFIANLIFHIADKIFSLSLYLHRRFHTPFWSRAEEGIRQVEDRMEEMEQLEAMGEQK